MKVLVCGGRNFNDKRLLFETLDALEVRPSVIIEGGANGADRMARSWAIERKVIYATHAAEWKKHGKMAGPIRNEEMITDGKPDIVVAFPGGKGTRNMVAIAEKAGVRVMRIKWGTE